MHNQKQSLKTFHPCKYKNCHTPCNAHTHTTYGFSVTILRNKTNYYFDFCLFVWLFFNCKYIYLYILANTCFPKKKKEKKSKTEGLRNLKTQNFIVMN